MIRDCHRLESDFLGVLEKRVWPPNEMQPLNREETILPRHVVWQDQPMILPFLSKENIGSVSLKKRAKKGQQERTCSYGLWLTKIELTHSFFFDWAYDQSYERTFYPLIIDNFVIVYSGI